MTLYERRDFCDDNIKEDTQKRRRHENNGAAHTQKKKELPKLKTFPPFSPIKFFFSKTKTPNNSPFFFFSFFFVLCVVCVREEEEEGLYICFETNHSHHIREGGGDVFF